MLTLIKRISASNQTFVVLASFVVVSLFLPAAFLTTATVLFVVFSLFNLTSHPAQQVREHKVLLLPVLLFITTLVGGIFSSYPEEALTLILRKAPLLLFPLAFLFMQRNLSTKDIHRVLGIFLATTIICSLICYAYAIANVIEHHSFVVESIDRPYYYFSYSFLTDPVEIDPIYLGMFCNLAFVAALTSPFIHRPAVRWAVAGYVGIFIILISSKIGIICLALVFLLWFISKNKKRAFVFLPLTVLLLVGVVNFPFLKDRFVASTQFDYKQPYGHLWNSTAFRLAIWSCSIETIQRKPMGYGTAGGQHALEEMYKEKGFEWGLREGYNPHNEFFSATLDLGIIGLLALIVAMALPTIIAVRFNAFIPLCFMLIVILSISIESALLRQKGIVFFSFLYSLLFAYLIPEQKEPAHES